MSVIDPRTPTLPAAPGGGDARPAVRSAQAAFFQAALGQAQGTPAATPAVQATRAQTVAPPPEPNRMARPGSLLDIRV